MRYDLIIEGGLAVLETGTARADIYISGGKIRRVDKPAKAAYNAARVIDARGLIILPGIIDAHVHYSLHLGGGKLSADDFYSGSAAAACVLRAMSSSTSWVGPLPAVRSGPGPHTRGRGRKEKVLLR